MIGVFQDLTFHTRQLAISLNHIDREQAIIPCEDDFGAIPLGFLGRVEEKAPVKGVEMTSDVIRRTHLGGEVAEQI